MSPERVPLLILGLGNLLCSDDGLGVAAVSRLVRAFHPPDEVLALDGGTLGLSLLPYLEDAEAAILVDAVRTGEPAGTFVRLEGDDVLPAVEARLSPHQVGVADLIASARLRDRCPRRLLLLGLVPRTLELGLGLSSAVEARMPELVVRIVEEARGFGINRVWEARHEPTTGRSPGDGSPLFGL